MKKETSLLLPCQTWSTSFTAPIAAESREGAETSAGTGYIFHQFDLKEEKSRPGLDGKNIRTAIKKQENKSMKKNEMNVKRVRLGHIKKT